MKYKWLTAAAKMLIFFLKAVLFSAQYYSQAENFLSLNLPRRLLKSIIKPVKVVSEVNSTRRREAGV